MSEQGPEGFQLSAEEDSETLLFKDFTQKALNFWGRGSFNNMTLKWQKLLTPTPTPSCFACVWRACLCALGISRQTCPVTLW